MNIYIYMLIMTVITYLIRMLPFTLFRKQITNKYIRSFLLYVPYACLTAMTVPAIFYATQSRISALCGLTVAVILGWSKKSLPVVAACACAAVFIAERIMGL